MRVKLFLLTLMGSLISLSLGASETRQPLSETDLIYKILEKNINVQVAQTNRELGHLNLTATRARFDTLLEFDTSHTIDKRDRTSTIFGTTNKITQFDLGFSRLFPTGTETSLKFVNQREATDSLFATINPNFDAGVEMSLNQPLLKNMLGKQDRGEVRLAKKQIEALDYQTQESILQETHRVLNHYWNLSVSLERQKIFKKFVDEAQHFLETTQGRQKLGLAQDADVFAAKANLLESKKGLLTAQTHIQDWQAQLQNDLDLEKEIQLIPTKEIKPDIRVPDFPEAMNQALNKRADYKAAQTLLEHENIKVSLKKNSRWPELDLFSTLTLNGVDSRYTHSIQESFSGDHPNWLFGLKLTVPLENRLARSEYSQAQLEKVKALLQVKQMENQIRQQIDVSLRGLLLKKKHLSMSQEIASLQEKKWLSELNRYKIGKSSSDLVIRYHNDYLLAEQEYLQASLETHLARLDFQRSSSTLFDAALQSEKKND